MNTCSAAKKSASPVTAIAMHQPQRDREQQALEVHRLAEQRERDQHRQVADELQQQRRDDRRVDDELVRKRDLADQSRRSRRG